MSVKYVFKTSVTYTLLMVWTYPLEAFPAGFSCCSVVHGFVLTFYKRNVIDIYRINTLKLKFERNIIFLMWYVFGRTDHNGDPTEKTNFCRTHC